MVFLESMANRITKDYFVTDIISTNPEDIILKILKEQFYEETGVHGRLYTIQLLHDGTCTLVTIIEDKDGVYEAPV